MGAKAQMTENTREGTLPRQVAPTQPLKHPADGNDQRNRTQRQAHANHPPDRWRQFRPCDRRARERLDEEW